MLPLTLPHILFQLHLHVLLVLEQLLHHRPLVLLHPFLPDLLLLPVLHHITSNDVHIDEKTNESGSSLDASLIDLDNSEVTDDMVTLLLTIKKPLLAVNFCPTTPQSLN